MSGLTQNPGYALAMPKNLFFSAELFRKFASFQCRALKHYAASTLFFFGSDSRVL